GRNVPLPMLATTLARLGEGLVIEWVPKADPMVAKLLATREDVFPTYDEAGFLGAFEPGGESLERTPVDGTPRGPFLMRRRSVPWFPAGRQDARLRSTVPLRTRAGMPRPGSSPASACAGTGRGRWRTGPRRPPGDRRIPS